MTYADVLRPASRQYALAYDAALVIGASLLVALCAQLVIPMWPVPMTGQTFAVLLVGALLGSRRGALAMIAYLAEGAMGLPFFAGASGGLVILGGPTGGYLIGFVAAAAVVGWLAERGWDRHIHMTALAMVMGNAVIYLFGVSWLGAIIGFDKALAGGLYPFLLGDLAKLVLAALLLPAGWRMIGKEPVDEKPLS